MRILILGGTGYIGPHHITAAVERGHHVSVFSRGQGQAHVPPGVEHLIGDRNGDLESIKNRDWDAVIDLSTYGPIWVRTLGEALNGRAKHYTFISSQDVYKNSGANSITDEASELREYSGASDPYSHTNQYVDPQFDVNRTKQMYGSLKVLCEREAERQFPGKTLILRPNYLIGPGDRTPAFSYWPERMERGGEVMATGDPAAPVQFTDVRDVAEWVIRMVERGETGIYNTTGPAEPINLGEMLAAIQAAVAVPIIVIWVPTSWLLKQEVRPISLLFWSSEPGGFDLPGRIVITKARAKGLTYRPLALTVNDILAWKNTLPPDRQGVVTTYVRDRTGHWETEVIPWDNYIEQERDVLAAWRAYQTV